MFLPPNSTPLLQPLDQGIAKCVKAAYVRLTFARIRDAIDANPQMSVMESWKNFTIADAIALIAEAVQTVKPETLNACWRPLWRNVVNDFKGFPSIEEEVANIRSIAMAINAEGFFDIAETDLRKHLDHSQQVLSNEELEELTRSSTDSDGDELDGSEDTQPPTWTLKKFADIFQQAQILKDKILEYDPSMERGLVVTRGITEALAPLQYLFDEEKKRQKQLPITMFLNSASPPLEQPATSSGVDNPSTSGKTAM
uniref:DDE-1 domain-containing protein n=2 Tax=Trichuris muris TaxID=70415 RepID=A0A5S6Q437_TRIMR